jgi:hypothetical protein
MTVATNLRIWAIRGVIHLRGVVSRYLRYIPYH